MENRTNGSRNFNENLPDTLCLPEVASSTGEKYAIGIVAAENINYRFQTHMIVIEDERSLRG